jgi:hypothetical protein
MTAVMQTSFGFKPFIDSGEAIADILGKTEVYHDWLRSGGAYSGFVELSRPELKKAYQELMRRPNLLRSLNIITHAQDISQLFEQATRVGVYKAAIAKGQTPVEAGFESRESAVDFGRRGAKTRDPNAVIAFLNAGVQGTDKSIRSAINDPVGLAAKGIALITLPSLLLWLRNKDDPDYAELPRWQKDLFWITKFPGSNTYVRIPKPFLYGQIFGSVPERFMEYLHTQDKGAFDQLGKTLYESILPITGDPAAGLIPTAIKPMVENSTNWNFFRQAPIVPESKQDLRPAEQYGRYTTDTAKALGKLFNMSPAKIENFIQGWFGGTGRYALEGGDLIANQIKKAAGAIIPTRPKDITQWPLLRGFSVENPAESGRAASIDKFYENRDELTQNYTTYRNYLKTGKKTEAEQLLKEHPELVLSKALDKFGTAISALNKQIDSILNSTDIPTADKKTKIESINRQRLELARRANGLLATKKKEPAK